MMILCFFRQERMSFGLKKNKMLHRFLCSIYRTHVIAINTACAQILSYIQTRVTQIIVAWAWLSLTPCHHKQTAQVLRQIIFESGSINESSRFGLLNRSFLRCLVHSSFDPIKIKLTQDADNYHPVLFSYWVKYQNSYAGREPLPICLVRPAFYS